jgi:hypothetical protein
MANDNAMPKQLYQKMLTVYPPSATAAHDLHHALFSKGLVLGMPLEVRKRIHDPRNLLWVRHDKHASHNGIPSQQEAYQLLCAREGQKSVDQYITEMLGYFTYKPFTLESIQGE